jgi:hypothetical protein
MLGDGGPFGVAGGIARSSPFWVSGIDAMKMISNTSSTSMSGVMFGSICSRPPGGRTALWILMGPPQSAISNR